MNEQSRPADRTRMLSRANMVVGVAAVGLLVSALAATGAAHGIGAAPGGGTSPAKTAAVAGYVVNAAGSPAVGGTVSTPVATTVTAARGADLLLPDGAVAVTEPSLAAFLARGPRSRDPSINHNVYLSAMAGRFAVKGGASHSSQS